MKFNKIDWKNYYKDIAEERKAKSKIHKGLIQGSKDLLSFNELLFSESMMKVGWENLSKQLRKQIKFLIGMSKRYAILEEKIRNSHQFKKRVDGPIRSER